MPMSIPALLILLDPSVAMHTAEASLTTVAIEFTEIAAMDEADGIKYYNNNSTRIGKRPRYIDFKFPLTFSIGWLIEDVKKTCAIPTAGGSLIHVDPTDNSRFFNDRGPRYDVVSHLATVPKIKTPGIRNSTKVACPEGKRHATTIFNIFIAHLQDAGQSGPTLKIPPAQGKGTLDRHYSVPMLFTDEFTQRTLQCPLGAKKVRWLPQSRLELMIRSQLPKPCEKPMQPHQEIPAVAPQADLPTEAPENVITSPIPSRTLKNPPDLQDRNFRIPRVQPAATEYTLTPPPLIQTSTALFSMGTPIIP